jgi:hypothetical protein
VDDVEIVRVAQSARHLPSPRHPSLQDDLEMDVEEDEKEREEKKEEHGREDVKEREEKKEGKEQCEQESIPKHGVITASLASLFRPADPRSLPSLNPIELCRRSFIVTHAIRCAAVQMARMNPLANWLMTLYVQDLVRLNLPIPFRLSDQNHTMWYWCYLLTTTENGEVKPHNFDPLPMETVAEKQKREKVEAKKQKAAESARRRRAKARKKMLEQEAEDRRNGVPLTSKQEKMARKQQLNQHAAETQKRKREEQQGEKKKKKKKEKEEEKEPTHEAKRRQQQRDCIKQEKAGAASEDHQRECYQHLRRVFHQQLLGPGFVLPDRQGLTEMLYPECQKRRVTFNNFFSTTFTQRQRKVVRHQVQRLPSFQQFADRSALRYLCTNHVVSMINRWSVQDDVFERKFEKEADEDLPDALLHDLRGLAADHQTGFGSSPLSNDFYQLSEEDCGVRACLYVHYFSYLSGQYERFDALAKHTLTIARTASGRLSLPFHRPRCRCLSSTSLRRLSLSCQRLRRLRCVRTSWRVRCRTIALRQVIFHALSTSW